MSLFSKKKDSAPSPGVRSASRGSSGPSNKFAGNKTWFGFAIAAAVIAAGLVFAVLSQISATTTYYVLNTSVPSRSQVLPSMLTEVQTSKGTEPQNALGLADVSYEPVFAKVDLNPGDILSASNTGDVIPLHQGIPENFVVASFAVDPNSAVGGKLNAGNYIDIYATSDGEVGRTTKSVLRHVLIMDVTASAAEFTEEDTVDNSGEGQSAQDTLRSGVPFLYTVAVTEEDAAILANVREDNLFVALSSLQSDTAFQDKNIRVEQGQVYSDDAVGNSGAGTDPNFGRGEDASGTTPAPAQTQSSSPQPTETASPDPTEGAEEEGSDTSEESAESSESPASTE